MIQTRSILPDDLSGLLALNNAHAAELSLLDDQRLRFLIKHAFLACVSDDAQALMIAFDQNAPYDSTNFLWFKQRYDRFVYIDRVVVAKAARGQGLARRLYDALFEAAHRAGHERVVCEVNLDPPNPASMRFHEARGFHPVGDAHIHGGAKQVAYLAAPTS